MKKLILHIPHASDKIPMDLGYVVDKETRKQEVMKLTDWYTDDLFFLEGNVIVKADFSRIFCDTERFSDDSQEIMAKYGMGVLYEKSDEGAVIREVNAELRAYILNNYYWPHHEKLKKAVEEQIESNGKATIVDCHSFPNIPHVRDLSQEKNRPDFNIGTDPFHTPEYLIDISMDFFKNKGFTVAIDWPYRGSIVPLKYYQKSKEVESIMLEINRSLYLNEPGNQKSRNYAKVKDIVTEYLKTLKNN